MIIENDEDGLFVASVPALRGCHSQAKSLDTSIKRIKEAIELCLESEKPISNEFIGVQKVAVNSRPHFHLITDQDLIPISLNSGHRNNARINFPYVIGCFMGKMLDNKYQMVYFALKVKGFKNEQGRRNQKFHYQKVSTYL